MILRKFSIWTSLLALTMSMGLSNLASFLPMNVAYAAVQLNVSNITCTDAGGACVLGGSGNAWTYVNGVTTDGPHINGILIQRFG